MEEQNSKNRMLILINVVLMTFMATLQGSIVNVALPSMAERLSVSGEAIAWVVTAFLIVVTSTILIFGKLGDVLGKTKVFLLGVAMFTFGSLLCGLSGSFPLLIAARVVQGIGAAGAMATNQGIIAQTFPKNERGRALGIAGSFVALGSLVGPPLGGFLVSFVSWNFIFFINVPIGVVVLLMGMKILPDDRASQEGMERVLNPFRLSLDIFRNRVFSLSIFCALISFVAISSAMIIQPFYLQNVMRYSPATTGFIMMANPLILLFVAPVSGHLSDKIGSEFLTFLGLSITTIGLLLMSTLTEYSSLAVLILFVAVMSIGSGMFQSPNTSLIMSSVTVDRLGAAGSINAFMRNLGMVIGTALSTTLLYDLMSGKLGYSVSSYVEGRASVFIYGMKYVYIVSAAICGVGALLTAYRLYRRRRTEEA